MQATTTISEAIEAIEETYRFRNPAEVRAFLAANPDLLDLLIGAASKILDFLPIEEPIVLDVLWDPEDEEDDGQLYAVVPTQRDPDEIRPMMTRMDREWLIDAFRTAGDRLNVAVKYR